MSQESTPSLVLCELVDPGIPGLESFSPFCLKVHRALRLAGLPYECRHGRSPGDFRAQNPTGQVPVLLVDGVPLADSTLILHRIDAMTGALTRGLDDRARAEAWLWEDAADATLNGYLVAARWADERNWPLVRDAYFGDAPWFVRALIAPRIRSRVTGALVARDVWRAGASACWRRFDRTLDELDARAPRREFWMGARVSVADIAIFAEIHGMRTPLTEPQRAAIAARPTLSAYLDRVGTATSEIASTQPAPEQIEARAN